MNKDKTIKIEEIKIEELENIKYKGFSIKQYAEYFSLNAVKAVAKHYEAKRRKIPMTKKEILEYVPIGASTLDAAAREGRLQKYNFDQSTKVYFFLDDVLDLFYPKD